MAGRNGKRGPRNPPGVTREAVASLFALGRTVTEVAQALGVTKGTVCYHARRLAVDPDTRFARRYDWNEIQTFYDSGRSIAECCARFGCSKHAIYEAARRGAFRTRPAAAPIERYLVRGRKTSRSHLKRRLLAAGLKENRCEMCGLTDWRGKPLFLSLHHVNGDGTDNRLANLAILCPNCHAQTPNFGSLNRRRAA